jgi:glycosyltransferase involved in cell wall biosynthesis
MKALLITNIPSPYRVLLFNDVIPKISSDFKVLYCAVNEPNRKWDIPSLNHPHIFLRKSVFKNQYLNMDIWKILKKNKPDTIITAGFNFTMLIAFFYAKLYKKNHIILTDSWMLTIRQLTLLHRILRRIIIKYSRAYICIGIKGKEFLKTFGADDQKIFLSPLAVDNNYYKQFIPESKEYDIVFSGQFIERKLPFFVLNVIKRLNNVNKDIRFLLLGDGPLKPHILEYLKRNKINYTYPGFVTQSQLPKFYSRSRLLLFPTRVDHWGIVANESCAVGVPVITSENSGVAGDLIIHNYNGFILPLDEEVWVKSISELFRNRALYNRFSQNALKHIKKYSLHKASEGIIEAIKYTMQFKQGN